MRNKTILYTTDSSGKGRVWECWAGQTDLGDWGIFTTDGQIGGKMKVPVFKKSIEKNVGKSNYLSTEDQAYKMVIQAAGKKTRKGYFPTLEEANSDTTFEPMLCPSGMVWSDYKHKQHVQYPMLISNKLDGARCNMFLESGEVYSQTRTRKEWKNNSHIEFDLYTFLVNNPSIVLDGELYNHEYRDNFEDLMSIIKKQKPTEVQREFSQHNVEYHIYDFYDFDRPNLTGEERQTILNGWFYKGGLLLDTNYCKFAQSVLVKNELEFDTVHNLALDAGYEGTISRLLGHPYGLGKRSKYLLKRKEKFDTECKVIDIKEGEGTWSGIAATVLIEFNGVVQDAGMAKGWTHEKCRELLERKDEVIGKMATIEYFELTEYGKLRFPKYKSVRDYE